MKLTQEGVEKIDVGQNEWALFCKGLLLDAIEAGDKLEALVEQQKQRIKELEAENKHLEDYIDAYQKSEALNIEKLDKKDERIKELREALIANDNHWLNVYKENIELKSKIRKLEGK